jgi:hypothetical protein
MILEDDAEAKEVVSSVSASRNPRSGKRAER